MNKRIKELALEARIAYYSKNGAYEGADEGLSVIPSAQSLEKFAELIVRECISAVDSTPLGYSDYRDQIEEAMRNACSQAIRNTFGVEE